MNKCSLKILLKINFLHMPHIIMGNSIFKKYIIASFLKILVNIEYYSVLNKI